MSGHFTETLELCHWLAVMTGSTRPAQSDYVEQAVDKWGCIDF